MKKLIPFICIILCAQLVLAQQVNDYNDYSSLDIRTRFFSDFSLLPLSDRAKIDMVIANVSFFPKNNINVERVRFDLESSPSASVSEREDVLFYKWEQPNPGVFKFGFNADVKVRNSFFDVENKIYFPLIYYDFYTRPTEFIDINPAIRQKAAELAAGEDDLYVVAFKIADWVEKNVRYDLNTLTADVVKPSSWVFANREGVCDELTNLFISMMRSLGVPARFVSGVAYTNLGYKWGPHGWAEVYFPKKGWVPFDVTYGQYGWIDPSHITLKIAADSGDPSVNYLWRALDVRFKPGDLEINAEILNSGKKIGRQVEFKIRPLVNNVGPGSYVPFEVSVMNKHPYYIPDSFFVTKAPKLTERNVKKVLLKPGASERMYWIALIPETVNEGFSYLTLVEVEDMYHSTVSANISYSKNEKIYSYEEAERLIEKNFVQEERVFTKDLEMKCKTLDYAFSYEKVKVDCSLRNKGNSVLKDLYVCLQSDCKYLQMSIAETKDIEFLLSGLNVGVNKFDIHVESKQVKAKDSVLITILESPDLVVDGFTVPNIISYSTDFNISFILSVKTPVDDVAIYINGEEVLKIPRLEGSKRVIVSTIGSEYVRRKNANITINFSDRNEKNYVFSRVFPLKLEKVPLFVKVFMWLGIV